MAGDGRWSEGFCQKQSCNHVGKSGLLMLQEYVKQLRAGVHGGEVLNQSKACYRGHSIMTNVYAVRRMVIESGYRNHHYDDSELRAYVQEPGVQQFLDGSLKKKCTMQRQHASSPSWSPAAEQALQSLQLLPSNMDSFHLSKQEILESKKRSKTALLAKNGSPFVVPDAQKLLQWLLKTLRNAQTSDTIGLLVPALQLATGRRQTEVTNGRSSFDATNHPMYARFTGQLKRKDDEDPEPYIVPLIVPYYVLKHAFSTLRQKQMQTGIPATNVECHQKYANTVQRGFDRITADGACPLPKCNDHKCRAIYAAMVYVMFECPQTFNMTAMKVLGHRDLADSLSYSDVRLEGCDSIRGAHGPLQL